MKYVLISAVFLLMVSVGMSLRVGEMVANWRRFSWTIWLRLLLATFLIPPAVVLLLHRVLPLKGPDALGLFMVAVVPGAPLMTRNIAKRGFDMHLAASYQVWGAILTPVVIPLVVFATGKLYDRDIWIPPMVLLLQIVEKQFVPFLLGIALSHLAPAFSKKVQPALNAIGNVVLTIVFVVMVVKMGPQLGKVTPWLVLGALLLATTAIAGMRLLILADKVAARTLAICNANRHVGLALLISGQYLHRPDVLPAVACYALVLVFVMIVYPKLFGQRSILAAASR